MRQIDQESRYYEPAVTALCREDDDGGGEQLAGWVMVLPDAAVAYVPDRNGYGALLSTFSSLGAAERLLSYGGLYLTEAASTVESGDSLEPLKIHQEMQCSTSPDGGTS
jgi:hypothetical protein